MNDAPLSLLDAFADLPDPRLDRCKLHSLNDILAIALCAAIGGADDWVSVERFGRAKEAWFRSFLELPNGIPSHDTFGRLFAALDPGPFQHAFVRWAGSIRIPGLPETVAFDGKTLRHSFDTASNKAALHMVHAWAVETGVALGQRAVDEKSNEITALPPLLKMLDLQGCVVTADAMGCQKAVTEAVRAQKADYVLALKANQPLLHQEVIDYFDDALQRESEPPELHYLQTVDGDHGRIETRRYWVSDQVDWIEGKEGWKGLKSLAKVESHRTVGGQTSVETRYFLSSLPAAQSAQIAKSIRAHWSVENGLHWVLDMAFDEDACRVRTGYAAENFAILRRIALNLLKQEKTAKVGMANKRLMAGWDEGYLIRVLKG